MRSISYFACIVAVACFVSCGTKTDRKFWNGAVLNKPVEITYDNLHLETLTLDPINCSYHGSSGIFAGKNICYIDKYFGFVYLFDAEGKFIKRELNIGRGPKETVIKQGVGHAFSEKNELTIMGSNVDFERFDSTFHVLSRFSVAYSPDCSDADRFETYS